MPDLLTINKDENIIEIKSYGVVSKNDIKESIAKIKQINNEIGINKVMVDTTKQESMPGTMGIFDIFTIFPRDFKVAVLTNEGQLTSEDIHFIETIAHNRGIMIKEFSSIEDAKEWLHK